MPAALCDAKPRRSPVFARNSDYRRQKALQIKATILHSRMVRIAKQIIHTISIHLSVQEIAPEKALLRACASIQQGGDIIRLEIVVII